MTPVDIVLPVYRGYREVKKCLNAVMAYKQQTSFQVIVVNDASPEYEIIRYIKHMAETDKRIIILHNQTNLGFVASVNRGMSVHPERDVVLLNSDTAVANDWLDRLAACAYQNEKIGTVSPFSNNATICSFPKFCEKNQIPSGWSLEKLDPIFSDIHKGKSLEIPTTVGFCMYIRRACLKEIGLFSVERFGQGYGEENDFCLRASKQGWKHLLCADTFVYHQGGVSFGTAQEARQEAAMEKLGSLYPDYYQTLHAHIKADPARSLRMAVLTEMIRKIEKEKILFISHHIGGGCEKHLQELGAYIQDKAAIAVIRSLEPGWITFHMGIKRDAEHLYFSLPENYQEIVNFCQYIGISRIHIHHIIGIDSSLWNLSNDLGVPFDMTLHDYYLINANPTLTNHKGEFSLMPKHMIPEKWHEAQAQLLYSAARVFVPSAYAANLYQQYFPKLKTGVQGLLVIVTYHPDWEQDAPYPNPRLKKIKADEPMRILVLGALSREKGADILDECAKQANHLKYPLEFHLLGYAYRPLSKAVRQSGCYNDEELDHLITEAKPHVIWFPAQWAETYSYTLSAALRSGLPLVVPDIGAFPERVQGRPFTWIEPWKKSGREWADFFSELRIQMRKEKDDYKIWDKQKLHKEFSYTDDYVMLVQVSDARLVQVSDARLVQVSDARLVQVSDARLVQVSDARLVQVSDLNQQSECKNSIFAPNDEWFRQFAYHHLKRRFLNKERILLYLLKIRVNPVISKILSFIPYRFQQNIKRWFSQKPIHEIMR